MRELAPILPDRPSAERAASTYRNRAPTANHRPVQRPKGRPKPDDLPTAPPRALVESPKPAWRDDRPLFPGREPSPLATVAVVWRVSFWEALAEELAPTFR